MCINSSHDGTVGGKILTCLSCGFLLKKLQTQNNEKEPLLPAHHEGIQQNLMEYSTQQCECTVNACSSQNPWKTGKHSSILWIFFVAGESQHVLSSPSLVFLGQVPTLRPFFPFPDWLSQVRTRFWWISQCFLIITVTLRVQLSGYIDTHFLGI